MYLEVVGNFSRNLSRIRQFYGRLSQRQCHVNKRIQKIWISNSAKRYLEVISLRHDTDCDYAPKTMRGGKLRRDFSIISMIRETVARPSEIR